MFPDQGGDKKPDPNGKGKGKDKGKPQAKPQGPGGQQDLHNPPRPIGPKPGQGMDPMEAMLGGMGDMSMFSPPAPQAPMGPGGLPVGGGLPSSDPMVDPSMNGSSLFQAINMGVDPYMAPPEGHGVLDPPPGSEPGLEQLLALLAMAKSGMPGQAPLSPSGVFNEPTTPGLASGLGQNMNVIQ